MEIYSHIISTENPALILTYNRNLLQLHLDITKKYVLNVLNVFMWSRAAY